MSSSETHDPSDSSTQRTLEGVMLRIVEDRHPGWRPVSWNSLSIELGLPQAWRKAKPDAVWRESDGGIVIAECYARIDPLKSGHCRKLAMDALKTLTLRNVIKQPEQLLCLLIVPEELEKQLQADSWLSMAIRQAMEVVTVSLTEEQRQSLREAVRRQGAGQARRVKSEK
jgi:hypothetical protein